MSDPLTIAAGEHGVTRVFALEMRPEQAEFLREPGAADQVLGGTNLDPAQIDVIRLSDLEELGLAGYLLEGCGIPEDQIAPDRARLAALKGYVLVLRSRAFGGRAAQLAPAPGVRLIASYAEPTTDWRGETLSAESARPYSAPRPSPRAARARARRIGGALFGVVMALILLVLWLVIA